MEFENWEIRRKRLGCCFFGGGLVGTTPPKEGSFFKNEVSPLNTLSCHFALDLLNNSERKMEVAKTFSSLGLFSWKSPSLH